MNATTLGSAPQRGSTCAGSSASAAICACISRPDLSWWPRRRPMSATCGTCGARSAACTAEGDVMTQMTMTAEERREVWETARRDAWSSGFAHGEVGDYWDYPQWIAKMVG